MSDEPKKRPRWYGRPWFPWTLMLLLVVAYPLSIGPALWWASAGGPHSERWRTFNAVYAPLEWADNHCDWFRNAMVWYAKKFFDPP
jgi:hypothetical protein